MNNATVETVTIAYCLTVALVLLVALIALLLQRR
jgi:hypothetical protein